MFIIYLLITPVLGCLKNYIKYKKLNIYLFLRSPLIVILLKNINISNDIFKLLIIERWIMFILKIIRSLWRNDYIKKKEKYKVKYKLEYNSDAMVLPFSHK